ncbi:hypothetical protein Hamer_G027344 [Homarus americanus]|uniref:Uncharacterized protein n=1 Tax=Homarus americanus TaxID=6706 RepID=A0A8J5KHP9_HOMAM|nr:hypothetical protein Hamer_G027344 [Homarus americanus]
MRLCGDLVCCYCVGCCGCDCGCGCIGVKEGHAATCRDLQGLVKGLAGTWDLQGHAGTCRLVVWVVGFVGGNDCKNLRIVLCRSKGTTCSVVVVLCGRVKEGLAGVVTCKVFCCVGGVVDLQVVGCDVVGVKEGLARLFLLCKRKEGLDLQDSKDFVVLADLAGLKVLTCNWEELVELHGAETVVGVGERTCGLFYDEAFVGAGCSAEAVKKFRPTCSCGADKEGPTGLNSDYGNEEGLAWCRMFYRDKGKDLLCGILREWRTTCSDSLCRRVREGLAVMCRSVGVRKDSLTHCGLK